MECYTKKLKIRLKKETDFVDITEQVKQIVSASKIEHGFVLVFTMHTTSAIRINENEKFLLQDMKELLERIVPKKHSYRHDQLEKRDCPPNERINGHSHLRSLLMGASEVIPLYKGKLCLGKWQSIFFVELDGYARERNVIVQVYGERFK